MQIDWIPTHQIHACIRHTHAKLAAASDVAPLLSSVVSAALSRLALLKCCLGSRRNQKVRMWADPSISSPDAYGEDT